MSTKVIYKCNIRGVGLIRRHPERLTKQGLSVHVSPHDSNNLSPHDSNNLAKHHST
jgi:hypothetical protein